MPRAARGPRRIDSTGIWYAVKVVRGKRHTISLKTKIRSEALRKWPAAQARLEELAEPWRLPRGGQTLITEWDPETGLSEQVWEWNENLVRDEYLYDEEDSSLITWAKAEEIAARRYLRRRGKKSRAHGDIKFSTQNGISMRVSVGHEAKRYPRDDQWYGISGLQGFHNCSKMFCAIRFD